MHECFLKMKEKKMYTIIADDLRTSAIDDTPTAKTSSRILQ
jgi:hypothetical protein